MSKINNMTVIIDDGVLKPLLDRISELHASVQSLKDEVRMLKLQVGPIRYSNKGLR
jgi:hypothetical protein